MQYDQSISGYIYPRQRRPFTPALPPLREPGPPPAVWKEGLWSLFDSNKAFASRYNYNRLKAQYDRSARVVNVRSRFYPKTFAPTPFPAPRRDFRPIETPMPRKRTYSVAAAPSRGPRKRARSCVRKRTIKAPMSRLKKNPMRAARTLGVAAIMPRRHVMRYCQDIYLPGETSGGLSYILCLANSVYNPIPNGAGTPSYKSTNASAVGCSGRQPMGYDQVSSAYESYCVTGATITLYMKGYLSTVDVATNIFGVQMLNDETTVPNDYRSIVERGASSWSYVNSKDTDTKVVKLRFNARQYFQGRDPLTDPNLRAAWAADPTNKAWFMVFLQHQKRDTASTGNNILMVIDYDVIGLEPKQLAAS